MTSHRRQQRRRLDPPPPLPPPPFRHTCGGGVCALDFSVFSMTLTAPRSRGAKRRRYREECRDLRQTVENLKSQLREETDKRRALDGLLADAVSEDTTRTR